MNRKIKITVTILFIFVVLSISLVFGKEKTEKEYESSNESVESIRIDETVQPELDIIEEKPITSETIIVEKKEAAYEKWLAASMIVGLSLRYPDFECEEIFLASDSALSSYSESKGVYVRFQYGGEELMVHSGPLEKERTEAGTIDLYTEDLGFASFDLVDEKGVEQGTGEVITIEDLSELINQSILVSMYEH